MAKIHKLLFTQNAERWTNPRFVFNLCDGYHRNTVTKHLWTSYCFICWIHKHVIKHEVSCCCSFTLSCTINVLMCTMNVLMVALSNEKPFICKKND